MPIKYSELKQEAEKHGLFLMSCLSREEVETRLSLEAPRLQIWQEDGFSGQMSFMQRPETLLCDPSNLLDSYKSIVTFLVPYSTHNLGVQFKCPPGYGKVARYAQGLDYHSVLRDTLNGFVSSLNMDIGIQHRIFSDSVPTLERAIASEAGLGFIGKSSMLISPELGTYTFICELIWNVEMADIQKRTPIKSRCGSCVRCKIECPTGAIVEDYKVDARKCISYLTIEKRDMFSREESSSIGDWIFGCDVCQDVCPHNINKSGEELIPEKLRPSSGLGPMLELGEVIDIRTREEFRERFNGTAILRTKREGLVRNALAVALNQKAYNLIPKIERLTQLEQDSGLKGHAIDVLQALVRSERVG